MHDRIVAHDDPDVRQAIEDKMPDVARIRDLASQVMKRRDQAKTAEIGSLFADLRLRADRIGVDPDTLILLVSRELDAQGRGLAPNGEARRRLVSAHRQFEAAEHQAHEALTRAQEEMRAATRARQHARSRCLAFGIEP